DYWKQESSHFGEDAFQTRSLRSDSNGIIGVMPDERDELEQAWEALADRERLLSQTVARRSAEIEARARRFDEIGADLDARRNLIDDAEEDLVEGELQRRAEELADEERVQSAGQRQLELRASQLESRTAKLQAEEAALEEEKARLDPRAAAAGERERALDERQQALAERAARHAEQE